MPQSLPPIAVYRRIAIGLLVTVGVVFIAVLYITLVRAEVTVLLKKQTFPLAHRFQVTNNTTTRPSSSENTPAIPGSITVVDRSSTRDVQSSTLRYTEGKATGVVRITNRYSRAQPLIPTTRLLSKEGVLFRTTEHVVVPVGGSIEVSVEADLPGALGDIGPTTFIIPGLWAGIQDKITGSSAKPTSGGKRPVVSLTDENRKEIEKQVGEQERMAVEREETRSPSEGNIRIAVVGSVHSTPTVVDEKTVRLNISTRIVVIEFNPAPLEEPLRAAVAKALPSTVVFGGVDSSRPFDYTLESLTGNTKSALLTVRAYAWGVVSPEQLPLAKEQLLGRTAADVKQIAQTFEEIESVQVKLSPFWLRSIPKRADRVELKVVSPTE